MNIKSHVLSNHDLSDVFNQKQLIKKDQRST